MDRREELERHVEWLAEEIGKADSSASVASLVRERRLTLDALAALPPVDEEVTVADQLAARRQARISGADDTAQPSRRGQSRRRSGGNRTG